jgi:hypothetical protein
MIAAPVTTRTAFTPPEPPILTQLQEAAQQGRTEAFVALLKRVPHTLSFIEQGSFYSALEGLLEERNWERLSSLIEEVRKTPETLPFITHEIRMALALSYLMRHQDTTRLLTMDDAHILEPLSQRGGPQAREHYAFLLESLPELLAPPPQACRSFNLQVPQFDDLALRNAARAANTDEVVALLRGIQDKDAYVRLGSFYPILEEILASKHWAILCSVVDAVRQCGETAPCITDEILLAEAVSLWNLYGEEHCGSFLATLDCEIEVTLDQMIAHSQGEVRSQYADLKGALPTMLTYKV